MSLLNFIKSRQFFVSLFLAIVIFLALGFIALQSLGIFTKHGDEIALPNLTKMTIEQATEKLDQEGLKLIVLDTVDFDKNYPPLTIVYQDPIFDSKVKEGRKIYVKVNAKGFSSVRLPNLNDRTLRHAIAAIEAMGLQKGEIRYEPHLAKDVVIQVEQDGRILRAGDKVQKNSKIDFVVGDGMLGFKVEQDTINDAFEDVAPAVDSIF
ncbi:PASTA domain-containing protein [Flavobacterium sp. I3-2]|uniref:PASTA domain-containing protein n=1 Tax=Flavobacterium sp. I3-2 TaxID=2748319 RepID=UPI0015B0B40D|nr:PASTA domain-containing protein [Flavobacterium sp. I3-2]